MNIACARCDTVLTMEVRVEGETLSLDDVESIDIADNAGMVLVVCNDCMTDREIWQRMMRSAVALLDAAEETIADLDMVMERIAETRENPDLKAQYAQAKAHAAHARAMMDALIKHEADFG